MDSHEKQPMRSFDPYVVVSLSNMLNKHWCCVDFRRFDARLKLLQCLENHLGSSYSNHTFWVNYWHTLNKKSCEIITLVIYVQNYFYTNVDSYFYLVNTSVASHVCIRNQNFVTTVPADVILYIGLRPSTDTVPSTWLDLISFTSPTKCHFSWWRHQMEPFSALLAHGAGIHRKSFRRYFG